MAAATGQFADVWLDEVVGNDSNRLHAIWSVIFLLAGGYVRVCLVAILLSEKAEMCVQHLPAGGHGCL